MSKAHITQVVAEAVDKRKGVTLKKNDDRQKKNRHPKKQFTERSQISKLISLFCSY